MSVTRTFTVTVVSTGSGNKYFIDGVQQATINIAEGGTYKFDQSDASNNTHPLVFSFSPGNQKTENVQKRVFQLFVKFGCGNKIALNLGDHFPNQRCKNHSFY